MLAFIAQDVLEDPVDAASVCSDNDAIEFSEDRDVKCSDTMSVESDASYTGCESQVVKIWTMHSKMTMMKCTMTF